MEACASTGMKTAQPCDRCVCGGLDRAARAPDLGPDRQAAACYPAHLFDWLASGQVVPVSPAASVRGPRHLMRSGKTAGLEGISSVPAQRSIAGCGCGSPRCPK